MNELQLNEPRSEAQKRAQAAFRARYRRIDFVPGNAALAAIERMRAERPEESMRRVLDRLILAGELYLRQSRNA